MRARRPRRGFTLVELLVAIAVMALLAVLSWRGLDGMTRAQAQTRQRADELLSLQAALAQWSADLDALVQTPQLSAIDWDGRVLRITRRSTAPDAEGPLVVAWSRRSIGGQGQWLRWQSPPLRSRDDLQQAWSLAALWAQNPGDEEKKREVVIAPLQDWQIFFFRGNAWTNPLSSEGAAPGATAPPAITAVPDGLRLVLTLPEGQALSGRLMRDWVRPTVGGGKS